MSHCPTSKTTPISGYSAALYRLVALLVLCLGLIGTASAQNSRYDGIVWSRNGFPSPGASIDVCSQPATTNATAPYCTPLANLCSSATDAVCASANPVIADSMGNFHFYVKPGVYSLESYNSSLSPFLQADQVLACPPSAAPCSLVSLLLGDGTVNSPAYSWTNATTSGWYRAGTNDFRFSIGAVDAVKLTSTQVIVPPTGMFGFGSSGVTSPDICFTRSAAGVAALGNCTAADGSGFLTLTQIISGTASGSSLTFSGSGSTFTLASGSGASNGGTFTYTAGNGGPTGAGGGYSWTAGNGGATSGAAGSFNFNCGTVVSGTACGMSLSSGIATFPTTNNTTSETWNSQPVFVFVTGDFSTAANTNLQAITGLTWTMPASLAINIPFDCYFQYSQATAAVSDSFGIQDVTTAPTQIAANGLMQTNTTAFSAGPGVVALASTTATAVMTATPAAITTVWHAEMHGVIEQPSGTASAITIMAKTSTSADVLTVKRGSYCRIGPK